MFFNEWGKSLIVSIYAVFIRKVSGLGILQLFLIRFKPHSFSLSKLYLQGDKPYFLFIISCYEEAKISYQRLLRWLVAATQASRSVIWIHNLPLNSAARPRQEPYENIQS